MVNGEWSTCLPAGRWSMDGVYRAVFLKTRRFCMRLETLKRFYKPPGSLPRGQWSMVNRQWLVVYGQVCYTRLHRFIHSVFICYIVFFDGHAVGMFTTCGSGKMFHAKPEVSDAKGPSRNMVVTVVPLLSKSLPIANCLLPIELHQFIRSIVHLYLPALTTYRQKISRKDAENAERDHEYWLQKL
jgi:hypothetical protein